MCGITGWLSTRDADPVSSGVVEAMRDQMAHRGPDGVGVWVAPDRRVGLGFRRLAIVDLSPTANQPMTNDREDGSLRLVFNGEIYNHKELRRELEAAGHVFKTDHADSETILHGYELWGEKVVEHLHGMFAFAIWDGRRRRLFLARDRVGIKPLYFAWIPGGFLFGSEIKAILAHPKMTAEMEPISVYHYLSFLTTPAPLTMFRGVWKLPAGWRASVGVDGGGSFSADRYWDALPGRGDDAAEVARLSGPALRDFAVRRTRELLDAAVEKRMMADVPFGVLLSGGVDSSTNVALMSRHMSMPVRTFTVGFEEHARLNELEYARQVARQFKTDHHEVMVSEAAMREYLPSLVYTQDEPIADWVCIPLYFVSKLVRDSGTIVVQVGEGSDEQFCGYRSYMAHLKMFQKYWTPFSRLPSLARRSAAQLGEWLGALDERHDRYWDVLVRAGLGREPFWSGATVFSESRKRRLVDRSRLESLAVPDALSATGLLPAAYGEPDSYGIVRSFFDRLDAEAPGSDILTRMIYSEFKLRLPELLLMRVDKIGMSVSIEPRVPFLDHELVEFTMNLPMDVKVGDGVSKSLLKQAVRGLVPDSIVDRPKMGFGAPMSEWLRAEFGRAVEASFRSSRFFDTFPASRERALSLLARHRAGRGDHALPAWTLFNAVAWFDWWIDKRREARVA
jgi:asparagine synthase (glutamine-hydrolysing)